MYARLLAAGHCGDNHVACLKTEGLFLAHQKAPREAKLGQARALVGASTRRFNREYWAVPICDIVHVTDT